MKYEKIPKKIFNQHIQKTALLMTLHCVRNTVIEDYHAIGKLTDKEMRDLNKEVADKIYSFLQILLNPEYKAEMQKLLFTERGSLLLYAPVGWNEPKFDKGFKIILKKLKKDTVSFIDKKAKIYKK